MSEHSSQTTAIDPEWEASIERDHHEIREILKRLGATTDLHVMLPLLEELRDALAEHFEREEAPGGTHEIIASMAPNTVASLQNVLGEHQVFTARLDDLIARARACLEGPLATILSDARTLTESLHDHEARETALFTDAVFTDLGHSG